MRVRSTYSIICNRSVVFLFFSEEDAFCPVRCNSRIHRFLGKIALYIFIIALSKMSRIFKSKYAPDVPYDSSIENSSRHAYPNTYARKAVNPRFSRGGLSHLSRISLVVSLDQSLSQIASMLEQQLRVSLHNCQFYLQDRVQVRHFFRSFISLCSLWAILLFRNTVCN